MADNTKNCPLCTQSMPHWERYPKAICPDCADEAVDATGAPVQLSNEGFSGGLVLIAGYARLENQEAERFPLFVRGAECRAEEHRFGGVVLQLVS